MSLAYSNPVLQTINNGLDERLYELILEKMNTEEQKQFVNNFKMYLAHGNDDTKFVVSLDNIWKWIGFSKIGHAKRLLVNKFSENINYILLDRASPDGLVLSNSVWNKEIILLNVSTFKKFCMKASTSRADEICDYYVNMENIMLQYTKEKLNEMQVNYENTKNELDKYLNFTTEDNIFWDENSIFDYDNKDVNYLAFIGFFDGVPIYKYGKSKQIYTREFKQHQKFFNVFEMVHIELSNNMTVVEIEFKKELKSKNLLRTIEINGKNTIELFTTTPQHTIEKIIQNLKDLVIKNPKQEIKDLQDEYEKNRMQDKFEKINMENDYLKRENGMLNIIKECYETSKINYKELKDQYNNLLVRPTINIKNEPQNIIQKEYKIVIDKLNNSIFEKDDLLVTKDNTIDELNNLLIKKDNLLIIKDNIIDDLNNKIIEKDNIIEDFKKNLIEQNEQTVNNSSNSINIVNDTIFDVDQPIHIDTIESLDDDMCITTDDFFEKYIIEGDDSLEDKYRILCVELFIFYKKKCRLPLSQYAFISYIENKYKNVESKRVGYNYIHKQMWVGIKLKNCKEKEAKLNIFIKKFIELNCEIDEKLCMYTKDFHTYFKDYCENNNFIPSRFNGWSEYKCREALIKLGYGFQTEYKNKYTGLAMKNNRDLCTNEEMIYFFIKDRCIITNNNEDIISSTDLWTAFQKYQEDTKRKISTNKQKLTERKLFEEIENSHSEINVKKYRSKYREAKNIKLKHI